MNNLTTREKVWLGFGALALLLIGMELGKHTTLLLLKRRMAEGRDARPTAAGSSPPPEA